MVRRNLDNLPEPRFPAGCGIRCMRPDDIGLWTDIQTDAEPILRITPDLFRSEFGHDPQAWGRRCFILTDSRGRSTLIQQIIAERYCLCITPQT